MKANDHPKCPGLSACLSTLVAIFLTVAASPAATVNVATATQLANAVNNGAAGDTINVAAGTYVLPSTLSPKPNMIIQGAGSASTILKPAASWLPDPGGLPEEDPVGPGTADPAAYMFNLNDHDGVKISGMTIDGLAQLRGAILVTYDGTNHEFFNLNLKNYSVAGIRAFYMQSSSIHDNTISGIKGHWEFSANLFLAWPYDTQIYNNRLSGSSMGIKIRQDTRSNIHNNTILNDSFAIEAPFDENTEAEYHHNFFKSAVSIPKEGGGNPATGAIQNHIHHNYFMPAYSIEFTRDGVEIDHNLFDLLAGGEEDGRLVSSWTYGDGPVSIHNNLIKNPGLAIFWTTNPYNNINFYNNHVIATPTPLDSGWALFALPDGTAWNTVSIRDNIIDCTTRPRPLFENPASYASVVRNNTLVNVSDSGSYSNPNTGATRGPVGPLNFTCGVNGEYTVNQWSITSTATGAAIPPAPYRPVNLAVTRASNNQLNLTWTDLATNETGFKIERYIGADYTQIATVAANVTSYANTGLPADSGQWYRVRAYNATWNSPYGLTGNSQFPTDAYGTTALPDQISSVSGPVSVNQGQNATVQVGYTAGGSRDVHVELWNADWSTNYASNRVTVAAGSGTAIINLAIPANVPAGTGYRYFSYVTAVGASWTQGVTEGTQENITVVATGLPTPWVTSDIGNPGLAGSATHSGGTFTINGSGADIWGTSDQFRYVRRPSSGNCSMTARVLSIQNTDPFAKSGVMIRESTEAGSKFAMVDVTPGSGVEFVYRTTTGGACSAVSVSGLTAPYWVRITRTSNSFKAYYSTNGSTWIQLGAAQTISMASAATLGMAVTSHDNAVLCTSTISNVTATP